MNVRAFGAAVLTAMLVLSGCRSESGEERAVTSLSYRGHERDADINCFIRAYPEAAGTRLDDCVLCHTEGEVPNKRGGVSTVNACDYCHYLMTEGEPWSASLNPFGKAYSSNGRDQGAFGRIEGKDSDGDGFSNLKEIRAGCFPGRKASNPDKPEAPYVELTRDGLMSLKSHQQFLLLNSHKQRCDSYVTYRGVRISELLKSQGVDVSSIEGITVFAPDGFARTYTREQVTREYPAGVLHSGLDDAGLGDGKGIVVYPATTPHGELADGEVIPGKQVLLLAYERDFEPISISTLDFRDHKIQGEGPFRLVRPQTKPSRPDRGSSHALGDEYDYIDSLDHNAGDSVRGVTVIRVDPMPDEYEEFDAMNASWRFLTQKKLIIYGYGIR